MRESNARASWARERMPELAVARARFASTVFCVTKTSAAIARLVSPVAARWAIRSSVALSRPAPAGPRLAEARLGARRPRLRTQLAKDRQRLLERRSCLLASSSGDGGPVPGRAACARARTAPGERSCSTSARSSASAAASRSPCAASRSPRQRADTARLQGMRDRAARSSKRATSRSARSRSPTATAASIASPSTRQIAGSRKSTRSSSASASERWRSAGSSVAGGQLGQAVAAAPDHRDDRFARPLPGGGAHGVEATGVRVDICAPRVDPLGLHAELLERVAHLSGEIGRLAPAPRPRLDHDAVEQDVGQRRIVALVARLPARTRRVSPARRPGRRRTAATARA